MDVLFKGFCKQVCRVLNARDMLNANDALVNTIANVMDVNVHVLHAQVGMRVMSIGNSALIVT